MINLAGQGDEYATEVVISELKDAGVGFEMMPAILAKVYEVKALALGVLHEWTFRRAWSYWIVYGPGLPVEYAVPLDKAMGEVVRASGDCACRGVLFWYQGNPANMYHVDTADGLKALADVIKQSVADAVKKFGPLPERK